MLAEVYNANIFSKETEHLHKSRQDCEEHHRLVKPEPHCPQVEAGVQGNNGVEVQSFASTTSILEDPSLDGARTERWKTWREMSLAGASLRVGSIKRDGSLSWARKRWIIFALRCVAVVEVIGL
jgi:hypothetical protein